MIDWIATAAVVIGAAFFVVSAIGLIRLDNCHSRLHALTKADNLGLGLVCLGLAVMQPSILGALKFALVWLFVLAASATSSYLIAASDRREGDQP